LPKKKTSRRRVGGADTTTKSISVQIKPGRSELLSHRLPAGA
jgi:hypothetical protein